MKNRLIALTALLATVGGPLSLRAQNVTPPPSKIGVINIQAAIGATAEGKKVFADLQKKYEPRRQELLRLQQEIQAIQDQLTKQAATLSDEEQARLSREAEDKQKLLKRSQEDATTDFNHDRDEAIGKIGQKMVKVISEYADKNGFTLIMDDAQVPIYFASKDSEITADIVKLYDAANPMADSGPPAKPATRPAAPASPAKPK
jgi:outer membrane protein